MRITVLDDDPGINVLPSRDRFRVTLDGVELKRCLTADDEAGEVIEVATDESGNIVTENGEVKQRTRKGSVVIQKLESTDKG